MTVSYPQRSSLAALALSLIFATPAFSDKVNEPWQSKREAASALTDKACSGDPTAVRKVWNLVEVQNDPVMQNNIGWLSVNCASFDVSTKEQAKWQGKAAAAGYPIAQGGYGIRLLRGDGVRKQSAAGVAMMLEAYQGGNANAMADLSIFFAYGKYVQKSIRQAKTYYRIAEKGGADNSRLKQARDALAANGGSVSSSSSSSSSNSSSSSSLAESAANIETKEGENIYSAIGRIAAESNKNCVIRLSHTCDNFKRFEGRTFEGQAHILAESIENVSFDGCEDIHTAKMTLSNNQIKVDPKLKSIPHKAFVEFEGLLLAFNRFVLHKYPGCSNNAETKLSYYKHSAGAKMSASSTLRAAKGSKDDAWKVRFE